MDQVDKHRTLLFADDLRGGNANPPIQSRQERSPGPMDALIDMNDGEVLGLNVEWSDGNPDPVSFLQIGRFADFRIFDGEAGVPCSIEAAVFPDLSKTYTMVTWDGQNFAAFSTEWENHHSPLVNPDIRPKPMPLIDIHGTVIGYSFKKVSTNYLFLNDDGEVFFASQLGSEHYKLEAERIVGRDLYITAAESVERYIVDNGNSTTHHSQVTGSGDTGVQSTNIIGGYKYRVKADKWADVLVDIDGFVRAMDTYGDAKEKSWGEKYNEAKNGVPLLGWVLPSAPTSASEECLSDNWDDDDEMYMRCEMEKYEAANNSVMFFVDILTLGESAIRKLLPVGRRAVTWAMDKAMGIGLRSARASTVALTLKLRTPKFANVDAVLPRRSGVDPRLHYNVRGAPDATVAADAAREIHQANRFAQRTDVQKVYLGAAAKKAFRSPHSEKFPDVVARLSNGCFALGEGKGTQMDKVVKQFQSAGARIGGSITEQEVVVQKLETIEVEGGKIESPGPGYGVDGEDFLVDMTGPVNLEKGMPPRVSVNGLPIKVIVMP